MCDSMDERNRTHDAKCAIKCLRSQEVNAQETLTKHLQRRNRYLLEIYKKSKERTNNWDIRSFMVTKDQ